MGGITRKVGGHISGDRGGEVLLPEGGEPGSEGRQMPTEFTVLVKAKHKRKSRVTPLPSLLLLRNGVPLWLTWLSRKGLCDLKNKNKNSGKDPEESGPYRLEDLPARFFHTYPPLQTSLNQFKLVASRMPHALSYLRAFAHALSRIWNTLLSHEALH